MIPRVVVGSHSTALPQSIERSTLADVLWPMAIAQIVPQCLPPEPDEHLVLVNQQTSEALEQLRTLLPDGSTSRICRYLDDTVIRVGGFANEEVATAWGEYLAQTLSVETAIVQPATPFADADTDTDVPPPIAREPSESVPPYDPELLEAGYAVLVDYADRPDLAIALQSALGEPVGLVVYRQTPYLLAIYSDSARKAGDVLTALVEADFNAIMVDSRNVVLMTPMIADAP
ncbi:MAG: hypothetical protein F6K16_28560 [Symploca sp. SIO2B6]|nr:hypothetical protein [Symploca sp. SIO2B6]